MGRGPYWLLVALLVMPACGQTRGGAAPDGTGGSGGQGGTGPGCAPGEVRPSDEACGRNGRGFFELTCTGSEWLAHCNDPDQCIDGNQRNNGMPCGEGGVELETCVEGSWAYDSCGAEPGCTDGAQRLGEACGDAGRLLERCVNGAWQTTGMCEMAECADGDERLGSACGLNLRGAEVERCVDGLFRKTDECDDADVCHDGDVQETPTCSRTCAVGAWHNENGCEFCGSEPRGGSLTAYDDAALEALRGVTEFKGDLTIGAGVTSLEPLSDLICADTLLIADSDLTDLSGLENLRDVKSLVVSDNAELTTLAGLDGLNQATHVELSNNAKLASVAALGALTTLSTLRIEKDPKLSSLAGLERLQTASKVQVLDNAALESLVGTGLSHVDELEIVDNDSLTDLQSLDGLDVRALTLDSASIVDLQGVTFAEKTGRVDVFAPLTSLAALAPIRQIETLILEGARVQDLHDLSELRNADTISLRDLPVTSFAGFGPLDGGSFSVFDCAIEDFSGLAGSGFGRVGLFGEKITTLAGLNQVTLQFLQLERTSIVSFAELSGQPISGVSLENNPLLTSLEGLPTSALTSVSVTNCPISSLGGLSEVTKLDFLALSELPELGGFESLSSLETVLTLVLEKLPFADFSSIPRDISVGLLVVHDTAATSLSGLERILVSRSLALTGNRALPRCAAEDFVAALIANGFTGMVSNYDNGVEPCQP